MLEDNLQPIDSQLAVGIWYDTCDVGASNVIGFV